MLSELEQAFVNLRLDRPGRYLYADLMLVVGRP